MSKKQNVIWITGASSGIGKALSNVFVSNGLVVLGTARRYEFLEAMGKSFNKFEKKFIPFQLDISNYDSIVKFFETISLEYEITDLINNAGVTSFNKVIDDSIEEIEKIIQTNLLGAIYAIKTVLPDMILKNRGTVINILSVVTQKIFPASSAYSASKYGLLAYTKVLREEVREKNIRVINVLPGATATSIWPSAALKKYNERMMSAEKIAELVYRLYSEKSNLVTEEVVIRPIDGDL